MEITEEDIPISLYLKLEQGFHADLETVSRASLSFVAIVQALAGDIEPNASVTVELISGTEGSLGVNTLAKIRKAANKANDTAALIVDGLKRRRIHWLALYVAFRILNNAVDWTQDQVMDWLSSDEVPQEVHRLSEEDRKAIANDIVTQLKNDVAEKQTKSLYRDLDRDNKIIGVGVTYQPKVVPKRIVPKSEFSRIAETTVYSEGQVRTVNSRIGATLISPVLTDGNRRWRFRGPSGEFGAPIRDADFLHGAVTGTLGIPLQGGVSLDIDLETKEVFAQGVWQIEGYAVTKVHSWNAAPYQPDLIDPAP